MSDVGFQTASAAGPLALLEAGLPVVVRPLPRSTEMVNGKLAILMRRSCPRVQVRKGLASLGLVFRQTGRFTGQSLTEYFLGNKNPSADFSK